MNTVQEFFNHEERKEGHKEHEGFKKEIFLCVLRGYIFLFCRT